MKQNKKIPFVPENAFTVVEQGKWVMVGPMLPCQCVIFIYGDKIIVGHLSFNASYMDFCKKIQQKIPATYDSSKIKVFLFTNESLLYDTICEQSNGLVTSWKDLYHGKSQKEVLEAIRDQIITFFSLNIAQVNIKINKWDGYNLNKDIYPLASLYVIVRNTPLGPLINNICPVNVIKYLNPNYNNTEINDYLFEERQYIKSSLEYPVTCLSDGKKPLLQLDKHTFFTFNL
ncbi:hypothetical protein EKK58_03815 [Candidatus Dependentiae bacterium]|nr:MAG: hypothetical protein EKK58_03815 [Candidatus Dependentiae bacterium]